MWGWSGGIFAEFLEDSITSQQIFTKLYKKSGEYQFEFHYKDPEDLLTNFFYLSSSLGKFLQDEIEIGTKATGAETGKISPSIYGSWW
jgi:hypothetical protein